MRVIIHYIDGHTRSEEQAQRSLRSFQSHAGWEPELRKGITPRTLPKVPYPIVGALKNDITSRARPYKTSCAMNHVVFYRDLIKADEPMMFAEHDALCVKDWTNHSFEEYLACSAVSKQGKNFIDTGEKGVVDTRRPVANTASYIVKPVAARKILDRIETCGLDKSEQNIKRCSGLRVQMIIPELCTLQPNLGTSHGNWRLADLHWKWRLPRLLGV